MVIRPRNLLFAMIFTFAALGVSFANNVYLAQTAQGSGNGTSCTNAYAASYFNNSSNWTTATPSGTQIGPGTSVFLCSQGGEITTPLVFQGNGSGQTTWPLSGTASPVVLDCNSGSSAIIDTYIDAGTSFWTIQNCTWDTSYAANDGTGSADRGAIVGMSGWSNGLIQNNHISIQDTQDVIFLFTGSTIDVKNNYLFMTVPAPGDGFDTDTFDWASATNVTVEGNYIGMNAQETDSCGSVSGGCHDDLIQTWEYSGNPYVSNSIVRYNFFDQETPSWPNGAANISWCMIQGITGSFTVYDNVFVVNGSYVSDPNGCGAEAGSGQTAAVYHYNNTFISINDGFGALEGIGGANWTSENNIFYRDTGLDSVNALLYNDGAVTLTYGYDFFYDGGLNYFPANCTSQPGNICSTSATQMAGMFVNLNSFPGPGNAMSNENLALASGSAAIGVATNLGSPYNYGIASGATWPNPTLATRASTGAWDMGAYVSSGGSAPAAPTGLAATVN